MKDENNIIQGILAIPLDTVIDCMGVDEFYDYVCEHLVNGRMYDVVYSLVGTEEDTLYIEITGDVTPLLEDQDIVG